MKLTPEQKAAVASWVTAGDNLSVVQKKLAEQFKITLTYMDVRFLVDDLDLALKDPAPSPSAQTDLSKSSPAPEAPSVGAPDAEDDYADEGVPPHPEDANQPPTETNLRLEVDNVTLIPGALASGNVTFSDGVKGTWIVDQQGRPGFTKISQPGYRPTPADAQAFMEELNLALQKRGF